MKWEITSHDPKGTECMCPFYPNCIGRPCDEQCIQSPEKLALRAKSPEPKVHNGHAYHNATEGLANVASDSGTNPDAGC